MDAEAVRRMCSGKKRFEKENAALVKAAQVVRDGGPVTRVYKCPNCKRWHLSTKTWTEKKT